MPELAGQERTLESSIDLGLEVLAGEQSTTGAWKGDYGGPLFLVPIYVAGLHILGAPPVRSVAEGFITYVRGHQNGDGGWGLDVESESFVFTSVLNYVALRLLGVDPSDPALVQARTWFLPRGGALASGSWGKLILALLGIYEYDGLQPVSPELWLLPVALPVHPSRLWCHCRMVYLPMSYFYGRRARIPDSPLLAALREEIYPQPYREVNWRAARNRVAWSDRYTPRTALLGWVHRALGAYERVHLRWLRRRALNEVLQ
ncbi:MAG TPA: prenyltransferase/squalene oxidase repeat-containing protein, partial [Myxococcales bacterium]